jgi:D-alanyl-D-alanine carboxypeptidase
MTPTKLGLPKGSSITVEKAILALAVKSANDIATVVAEYLGGSEVAFARMMTEKAHAIGMKDTTFRNASGLPNRGQLSTARDMARLSIALIKHYPQYYGYFSYKSFKYDGRTYRGHNNLLDDYKGTDGIKTGYIRASGFNLAASVVRDGRRLIAVVFGGRTARTRDAHMMKLLDRGYIRAAQLDVPPPAPGARNPYRETTAMATVRSEPQSVQVASTEPAENSFSLISSANAAETSGNWSVQVGAFHAYAPAEAMAKTAVKRVPDLASPGRIEIPSTKGDEGTLYRARLGGFSEGLAREACRRLEAAEMDCLVVNGGG